MIEVLLITANEVTAVLPKVTAVAPVKPLPVMATDVPPRVEPYIGKIPVTAGAVAYVYLSTEEVADVPPGVVTVTSTVPAGLAGDVTVIEVALFTVYVGAAVPPKVMAVAPVKPVR